MQMGRLRLMMENNYKQIFALVLTNNEHHARFLNTLSLMELSGAKKLARLVDHQSSAFLLEHVAEEFRHAYFLRKLAQKIAGFDMNFSEHFLLPSRAAKNYISTLDRCVCLLLKKYDLADKNLIKERAYLLTTFAVESRALPFYEAYQENLKRLNIPISVKSIISEEDNHLNQVKEQLKSDHDLAILIEPTLALENRLFQLIISQMVEAIAI